MPHLRLRLPRRTVRLRLTALYGGLFLLSGAGLLAITYGLVAGRSISGSFGLQAKAGGGVTAVVVSPVRVVGDLEKYARCMRSHGVTAFPDPKVTEKGNGVQVRLAGLDTRAAGFKLADHACAADLPKGPGGAFPVAAQWMAQTPFAPGLPDGSLPVAVSAVLPTPAEKTAWLTMEGMALGVMALASVGLGWLMAGRALRPLRAMTATARQMSEDNLSARFALGGPDDELKDLGDTFDDFLGRLEGAFEAQRRFVSNAAHELRTPLAMMRTSLDVALGKPSPPHEVTVLAAKLEEGLDQAEVLLDNLLVLARSQRGALGPAGPVSLPGLARACLEAERPEMTRLGLSVEEAAAPAEVLGNHTLLARMVANLISNAVRHNIAGGTIRIRGGYEGNLAFLAVENTGPVLAPERVAQLGEPFYRPGSERVGNGHGLGLSVAKAVASAHNGELILEARPEGGLRAVVRLPSRSAS